MIIYCYLKVTRHDKLNVILNVIIITIIIIIIILFKVKLGCIAAG